MLYSSLKKGEGRFCGNIEDAELDLNPGDNVIYINVPQPGRCTLARVTGRYLGRSTDEDFNHRFLVDPDSVRDFDRNSDIVHPALSRILKLMGRWWRIYDKEKFEDLLNKLEAGEEGKPHTQEG